MAGKRSSKILSMMITFMMVLTLIAPMEVLAAPTTLTSFTPITLTQTGDIAHNNVQYTTGGAVILALPDDINVILEDASDVDIPITWDDTDGYDSTTAADYTFTATWGTMPAGASNENNLPAPTVEVTVAAGTPDIEITEYDRISSTSSIDGGTAGSATYATVGEAIAALGTTVTVTGTSETAAVSWANAGPYDPSTPGMYEFIGTIGTLPTGYVDDIDTIATVTGYVQITGVAATVTFDAETYDFGDTVTVTLTDADYNTDPENQQSKTVGIISLTDSEDTRISVFEDGVNSNIFIGEFTVSTDASINYVNKQVVAGDTITVFFNDGDTGSGSASVTDTATINGEPVTYAATVEPVEGGSATVAVNPAAAIGGATVTVDISDIEAGKQFKSIVVNGALGDVTTTEVGVGTEYTFTMPAEAVTVTVTVENMAGHVINITTANTLLVGRHAFTLDDASYTNNNYLAAVNNWIYESPSGSFHVYYYTGSVWYDVITDPTLQNAIDLNTINGDGGYEYTNMIAN